MKHSIVITLILISVAFAGEPKEKEYQLGTLAAGANSLGIFAAHIYRVIGQDGWEYTLSPAGDDPIRKIPVGAEVRYRIERGGKFWTPDPRPNKPDHEAKYHIELADRMPISDPPRAVLTNDDVIAMVQTGLSPTVIIAKIKTSLPNFDVSVGALKNLKEKSVPDSVVSEMITRSGQ
jgi:hypothetical protein